MSNPLKYFKKQVLDTATKINSAFLLKIQFLKAVFFLFLLFQIFYHVRRHVLLSFTVKCTLIIRKMKMSHTRRHRDGSDRGGKGKDGTCPEPFRDAVCLPQESPGVLGAPMEITKAGSRAGTLPGRGVGWGWGAEMRLQGSTSYILEPSLPAGAPWLPPLQT